MLQDSKEIYYYTLSCVQLSNYMFCMVISFVLNLKHANGAQIVSTQSISYKNYKNGLS